MTTVYPQSPPTHKYVLPLAREEGGGTHTTPGLLGMLQAAQVPRTRQRALQAAAWLRIWRSARTARAIPRLSACATAHCGQLYGRHVMVGMLKPCVRVKSRETERWRELHLVWAKRSFGKRVKFSDHLKLRLTHAYTAAQEHTPHSTAGRGSTSFSDFVHMPGECWQHVLSSSGVSPAVAQ